MASPSGMRARLHADTHLTLARKPGIQSGPRGSRLRHHALTEPPAGTTSVTSWPRCTSRSAWMRIARTPPATRRCGHRNVTFISARSYRHGYLAGTTVGGGVQHHVDGVDLVRAKGALERWSQLARFGHVDTLAAEGLHHPVVAGERQRRSYRALGAEERQLRVANLPPAAIVADHHRHRQPEPHRGLDLHAVEAEGAIARDEEHPLLRPQQLGRDRKGRADPEAAEGTGIEPLAWPRERHDLRGAADHVAAVTHHGRAGVHHRRDLVG